MCSSTTNDSKPTSRKSSFARRKPANRENRGAKEIRQLRLRTPRRRPSRRLSRRRSSTKPFPLLRAHPKFIADKNLPPPPPADRNHRARKRSSLDYPRRRTRLLQFAARGARRRRLSPPSRTTRTLLQSTIRRLPTKCESQIIFSLHFSVRDSDALASQRPDLAARRRRSSLGHPWRYASASGRGVPQR